MRLSAFAVLATALLPSLVSATYFTSPTAGATWDQAAGQTITWHYQAGGAPRGDIILQSTSSNPKAAQTKVVATDVDLTSESVTVPAGLGASSATSWTLLMVNSNNYGTVYSQAGPFTIASFAGSAESSPPASSSTAVAGGAVGNGSGQDATATNPAVGPSTASSTSQSSSKPLVTATVILTASGVEITSTLTADSASLANATTSGGPVTLATMTASDSARSTATFIGAPASAATGGSAGQTSRAGRCEVAWAAALCVAAAAAAWGL
ncbi:hypothetical protein JCM3770_001357 [Rhodotorula araucariae]